MGCGRTKVDPVLLAQLLRVYRRSRLGGRQRRQDTNERLQERAARSSRRRGISRWAVKLTGILSNRNFLLITLKARPKFHQKTEQQLKKSLKLNKKSPI